LKVFNPPQNFKEYLNHPGKSNYFKSKAETQGIFHAWRNPSSAAGVQGIFYG
jgi:hypothetical protein